MSLKVALETLGFSPCYHMVEVFEHPEHADFWLAAWRGEPADWDGVLGGYEAAVDWPACTFYEELMQRNPEAKVILTVRDPQDRLLVYEVKEGWEPLCEFLGVEVPDEPFPRLNDTAEMRRRIRTVQAISLAVPAVLALLGVAVLALLWRRAGQ